MTEVLQIYINCKYENGNDIRIYEVGDKINQSTKLNCKKSFRFPGSITKTRYVNSKSINILSKEIKEALKLSYKMNGEVDDIINALGRRLTIFLKQIDNIDKNCPPFDSRKDS